MISQQNRRNCVGCFRRTEAKARGALKHESQGEGRENSPKIRKNCVVTCLTVITLDSVNRFLSGHRYRRKICSFLIRLAKKHFCYK